MYEWGSPLSTNKNWTNSFLIRVDTRNRLIGHLGFNRVDLNAETSNEKQLKQDGDSSVRGVCKAE